CYSFVLLVSTYVFLFTATATTEIYPLSLHDALPISALLRVGAGDDPDLLFQPVPLHRLAVPVEAVPGSGTATAGDVDDLAVPEADQVIDGHRRPFAVVNHDAVYHLRPAVAVGDHGRHLGPHPLDELGVDDRPGQDQAVDLQAHQSLDGVFLVVFLTAARVHQRPVARLAGGFGGVLND